MKVKQNLSILIWANLSKKDKNGLIPLYARITIDGKRAEISLYNKVHPDKSLGDPRFGAILMRIFKDLTNKFMEAFPDSPLFKDKPWEARLAGEGKKKRCRHCGLSKK